MTTEDKKEVPSEAITDIANRLLRIEIAEFVEQHRDELIKRTQERLERMLKELSNND